MKGLTAYDLYLQRNYKDYFSYCQLMHTLLDVECKKLIFIFQKMLKTSIKTYFLHQSTFRWEIISVAYKNTNYTAMIKNVNKSYLFLVDRRSSETKGKHFNKTSVKREPRTLCGMHEKRRSMSMNVEALRKRACDVPLWKNKSR